MSDTRRKYATINHPTIAALVGDHYRYKAHAQALKRFHDITANFVLSKEQSAADKRNPSAILWIKGFGLTDTDETAGFTGHFAKITIVECSGGLFTLKATKLERLLAVHPQKKRPSTKHPNWGHPVMRSVKRGKLYDSLEKAQADLELLHLEFPEVSIPGGAKLYIIIYEKREGIARPTHKILLEIEAQAGGGFIITCRDNEKTSKSKATSPVYDATNEASAPGHFTSTEAVRKLNRRRTRPTAASVEVSENDTGKFGASEKERKKRKKKKKLPRVTATPPAGETTAQAQARFRNAELERETRRRRRVTIFDAKRQTSRDKLD